MSTAEKTKESSRRPLAEQLRPAKLDEFAGLSSLDQGLVRLVRTGSGRPPSLILWGPPGSGKTTLAKLIGGSYAANFVELSAVLGGVKDVRDVVQKAGQSELPTILFVDEIHRFNKAQQDAFLPHVEAGTISLIGATTENPSFYLTGALLSRCRVVVLPALSPVDLEGILNRSRKIVGIAFCPEARALLIEAATGDGRRLLNMIEGYASQRESKAAEVTKEELESYLRDSKILLYDRSGEEHYNIASAFIKSLRGSDADAALYWGFRMLEAGEDPRFVIRRLVIFASEDIGNADPRALQIAVSTLDAYNLVGLPEGRIPIAQCITYLATAPKSNRSYMAMHAVLRAIEANPAAAVPVHLRNAPTKLMKSLGYGDEYVYPHDQEAGYAAGVTYLPKEVSGRSLYEPSDRGYEKTIGERLAWLKSLDKRG